MLLAVSNQPVWSDTWALGGLFLASGLTGSAALLLLLTHYRRDAADSSRRILELGGRLFAALEVVLLVAFILTLIQDGALDEAFGMPWTLLWLVAVAGMIPAIGGLIGGKWRIGSGRAFAALKVPVWAAAPTLVLVGVLALRAAVIFSAQA